MIAMQEMQAESGSNDGRPGRGQRKRGLVSCLDGAKPTRQRQESHDQHSRALNFG